MSEVIHFGASGDGKTDDTNAIQHAIHDGDGPIVFARGDYRITKTIEIDLDKVNRIGIDGSLGTAKVIMDGPGPAFRFVGTHGATADPLSFNPNVWQKQRFPVIQNIEITGTHPQAIGIELVGTMQASLVGVLLRDLHHGIHLVNRNRNVLISGCQIYHNTGVGVYCDAVNLHQINITGNHISYNRLGGIRIDGSEIRNLQITGNDIEYNNYRSHPDAKPEEPTAEILIDCRGEVDQSLRPSVREFTIASNTIQATHSPGGANIRILGPDSTGELPPGMAAISGNVIGNQAINVHLQSCRGIALSGNFIYSGWQHNLLAEHCDDLSITGNTFGHNSWRADRELQTNIQLVDSTDCVLSGLQVRGTPSGTSNWVADWSDGAKTKHDALIELLRCRRISLTGCHIRDATPNAILLDTCEAINISGCQIHDTREKIQMKHAVLGRQNNTAIAMSANILGVCTEETISCQGVVRDTSIAS